MKNFKNVYIFFFNNIFIENNNNKFFNFLKIFSLNLKYKIKNDFLKITNFILILKLNKNIINILLKFFELNKNNLLFFYFNKKLYNNNKIDIFFKNGFFDILLLQNFKIFYFYFYLNFLKLYFLVKITKIKEICQQYVN